LISTLAVSGFCSCFWSFFGSVFASYFDSGLVSGFDSVLASCFGSDLISFLGSGLVSGFESVYLVAGFSVSFDSGVDEAASLLTTSDATDDYFSAGLDSTLAAAGSGALASSFFGYGKGVASFFDSSLT